MGSLRWSKIPSSVAGRGLLARDCCPVLGVEDRPSGRLAVSIPHCRRPLGEVGEIRGRRPVTFFNAAVGTRTVTRGDGLSEQFEHFAVLGGYPGSDHVLCPGVSIHVDVSDRSTVTPAMIEAASLIVRASGAGRGVLGSYVALRVSERRRDHGCDVLGVDQRFRAVAGRHGDGTVDLAPSTWHQEVSHKCCMNQAGRTIE